MITSWVDQIKDELNKHESILYDTQKLNNLQN